MTAAELLADLTAQGFRLEVCEDRIAIEPGSKVTDALIHGIREHKEELRILIHGEPLPKAQVTAPEKAKRKSRKRVTEAPAQTREEQAPAPSAAAPCVEVAASPVAVPPAPEPTVCRRCGATLFRGCGWNPKDGRCPQCFGYVNQPDDGLKRY
jgi:hypothetical protein